MDRWGWKNWIYSEIILGHLDCDFCYLLYNLFLIHTISMKEPKHCHPVTFADSVLTMSNFCDTCEAIHHSGYRPSILQAWRDQLLVCATKDENTWRKKLALLGRTVADLLDKTPRNYQDSNHHMSHIAELGTSIGKLRYDVMLRVAHKLHLGEEIERTILQMLLLSLKHMKSELEEIPIKIKLDEYRNRLHI